MVENLLIYLYVSIITTDYQMFLEESVKRFCSKERCDPHYKYFRYLHRTNLICAHYPVCHQVSQILCLQCHYWQSYLVRLCYLFFSWRTLHHLENKQRSHVSQQSWCYKMEFYSLGGEDGEHNDVDLAEISQIFAMQDTFLGSIYIEPTLIPRSS